MQLPPEIWHKIWSYYRCFVREKAARLKRTLHHELKTFYHGGTWWNNENRWGKHWTEDSDFLTKRGINKYSGIAKDRTGGNGRYMWISTSHSFRIKRSVTKYGLVRDYIKSVYYYGSSWRIDITSAWTHKENIELN